MPTIQELEAQIYQLTQQLDSARQQNPTEPVQNYTFTTPDGPITLAELFGPHNELFIIHNMGQRCSYCTMWADVLNPLLPTIREHAEVALCSPDSPELQTQTQLDRGWNYRLVNNPQFTTDMGYHATWEENGTTMNSETPGMSAFRKLDDGTIIRINHTPFGPLDSFNPVWHFWSLLGGKPNWEPQ
jgi:predicted dithiol-disulfide oxidoreductase (DUF899 family)